MRKLHCIHTKNGPKYSTIIITSSSIAGNSAI